MERIGSFCDANPQSSELRQIGLCLMRMLQSADRTSGEQGFFGSKRP